ncbi:hypothetical protein TrRE_jg8800 [Triparma retinervis]|uniref:Uncharacterized protein n=1 Tax=Triparma retinervis TaxID=2557542 RepID=A0A9W6ZNX0_9STRA|nr:hypothetical protein TrRE_jg8800 [Triparma retinervis]
MYRVLLNADRNVQRIISSYYNTPTHIVILRNALQPPKATDRGDIEGGIEGGIEGDIEGDIEGGIEGDIEGGISGSISGGISGGVSVGSSVGPSVGSPSCFSVYSRSVDLMLGPPPGVRYCRADSRVTLKTENAKNVYKEVGLAQLYQRADRGGKVEMDLEGWGWGEGGKFWREYRLEGEEVDCRIREEFEDGLWELGVGGESEGAV